MGLFKSKEEKEMMLNSTIQVKTKDELNEAIKKGYGTIVPIGPLADKLVAKMKRNKILRPVTGAITILTAVNPATCAVGVVSGLACLGACTTMDYNLNMDSNDNYIFVHKKLAAK